MVGWKLVVGFNLITAASYLGIAGFIVRGLTRTHQLAANRLAVATALIFVTCALHHTLHAMDLVTGGDFMQLSMMREMMGNSADVLVTMATAVVGVGYLGLRRSYGMLLHSPAMFGHADETRYRQLAANLPHTAVFLFDHDLRFTLVCGAGMAEAGYDPALMEGKLFQDVVPPQVSAAISPKFRAALAGEHLEYDNVSTVTGHVFHNRARPLTDESGRIIAGLVVSEDVTQERAIQEQLAEAQAFGSAVLAASPDITLLSDLSTGLMTWASRSVLTMLGRPPGATLADEGPQLLELVLDEDRDALRRTNVAVAQLPDGESITVRIRVSAADGYRWLARQSTPFLRNDQGAVVSYLSILRDVTDVVEVERRMEHAALHDPLTGLPNRALLLDRMSSALARADRLDAEVAVLFCDLDGFKKVNDTDGHAAGDAVLIEVARRLNVLVRKSDSVARVGGDEFVIVLDPAARKPPESEGDDPIPLDVHLRQVATMVADRVRKSLSGPIEHDGRQYVISVSIGLTFAPRHSRAPDVLRDADIALYRAKTLGKNRVEVFDAALGADVVERLRVEAVLRRALDPAPGERAVLTVAYQPVYDLADNALAGFEALARLTDEHGQAVGPDVFIPIAEESGLITTLGERVLDAALGCLMSFRTEHPLQGAATMAVNLSARQAQHADMPQVVRRALDRHGVEPAGLILELTESVLLESGSSTLRQLTELRAVGVGIAIDDFGTGYASLRYLATLPVSCVKVDRSFTATMTEDRTSATIVHAITTLAADLGLDCVVEGVETLEQLRMLPSGVQGQGYLLGRPAPQPRDTWLVPAG